VLSCQIPSCCTSGAEVKVRLVRSHLLYMNVTSHLFLESFEVSRWGCKSCGDRLVVISNIYCATASYLVRKDSGKVVLDSFFIFQRPVCDRFLWHSCTIRHSFQWILLLTRWYPRQGSSRILAHPSHTCLVNVFRC